MSKSVGLITIQSDNYGNRLQNYAVQTIVENLGFEPVSYKREYYYNKKHKKKLLISKCLRVMKPLLMNGLLPNKLEKSLAGAAHIDNMNIFTGRYIKTSKMYAENINSDEVKKMAYFLCGSDQLWNPMFPMVSGIDFLDFSSKEKNIAISASLGVEELPSEVVEKYKNYMKNFLAISVREEKAKVVLQTLTDIDISVLLDPTMMLTVEEWSKVEKKVQLPDDYIVVYLLDYSTRKNVLNVLNQVYPDGCPSIVWILDKQNPENYWYGPSEFLYVLHHASAVFTDSFHGTVFSLIFHKDVRIFKRHHKGYSMNSRVTTLLDKMGISDEIILESEEKINQRISIDFASVDKNLKVEREKYNKFLKEHMR